MSGELDHPAKVRRCRHGTPMPFCGMCRTPEEEREIYGDDQREDATRFVAQAMAEADHKWRGAFDALPATLQEDYLRLAAVAVDACDRFDLQNYGAK